METPDWAETTWDLDVNTTARAIKAAIESTGTLQRTDEDGEDCIEFTFSLRHHVASVSIEPDSDETTALVSFKAPFEDAEYFEPIAKHILKEVVKALPFDPDRVKPQGPQEVDNVTGVVP